MIKKTLVITHLAIAFAALLWMVTDPFMGEMFLYRKRAILYQQTMGSNELIQKVNQSEKEKIERNATRFSELPQKKKKDIQEAYLALQEQMNAPFLDKLTRAIRLTLLDSPPLYRAWIALSILVCLLILYGFPSAKKGAWAVAFLALLFAIDNHYFAKPFPSEPDEVLFPTEKELVPEQKGDLWTQQKNLQTAWDLYLKKHWSSSNDLDEAEFRFTFARLDQLGSALPPSSLERYSRQRSLPFLLLFVSWSFLFGFILNFPSEK